MRRNIINTILGVLAAVCAAWLLMSSIRDIATKGRPVQSEQVVIDGTVCSGEFVQRMYNSMRLSTWLTVLSAIACAVAAIGFLKVLSAKLAYGASAVACLVGAVGTVGVFQTAATGSKFCTPLNTPEPQ